MGSAELLVQAVQAFKSGNLQSVALAAFGVFLPQLLSTWLVAPAAGKAAGGIWSIALEVKRGTPIDASTFLAIKAQLANFFSIFMVANVVMWLVFLVAYLALVYQSLSHLRPWAFPRLDTRDLLGDMTRLALKRGLLLTALAGSLAFATQAFPLTSLFLGALTLMAPVLMVAERKSAVRSLMHSISLRYARQVPLGGWSAVLGLFTIGGLFFSFEVMFGWLAEELLDAFATASAPMINAVIPGMPFTAGFALVDLIQSLLTTALVCLLPGATASLYIHVHFRQSKRDISILA